MSSWLPHQVRQAQSPGFINANSDRNRSLLFAGLVAFLVGVLSVVPNGPVLVAALCAGSSLLSTPAAMGSIFALLIIRTINPALGYAAVGEFELIAWGAMLLASGRIWLDAVIRRFPIREALPPFLMLYGAVLIPLCAFSSAAPLVSLTKAASFLVGVSSITLGFAVMRSNGWPASSWIKGFWICVILLSIPTLLIPGIGYARDGQGFQGVLYHPQGFSVFLAPIVTWSFIVAISSEGRGRSAAILFFIVVFASLWLTRGRTGFAAIIVSLVALLIFRPGLFGMMRSFVATALLRPWVLLGLTLLLAVGIWHGSSIAQAIQAFTFKQASSGELLGAFEASRGFIADQQIRNFQDNPIGGIGFGVSNSNSHGFEVVLDSTTGLPVGAATEKANLFLAVLEETGVIGALAFAPFFFLLVQRLARTASLAVAWAGLAALATNLSEVTFFSLGGIGLYTWLVLAWALSEFAPRRRLAPSPVPSRPY
jgi:hypothetical protein